MQLNESEAQVNLDQQQLVISAIEKTAEVNINPHQENSSSLQPVPMDTEVIQSPIKPASQALAVEAIVEAAVVASEEKEAM